MSGWPLSECSQYHQWSSLSKQLSPLLGSLDGTVQKAPWLSTKHPCFPFVMYRACLGQLSSQVLQSQVPLHLGGATWLRIWVNVLRKYGVCLLQLSFPSSRNVGATCWKWQTGEKSLGPWITAWKASCQTPTLDWLHQWETDFVVFSYWDLWV